MSPEGRPGVPYPSALVRRFGGFNRAQKEFSAPSLYREVRRVLVEDGVNVNMDYNAYPAAYP